MVARVGTVAFQGIEAVPVDVQVMVAPGKMGMSIYGLINIISPSAYTDFNRRCYILYRNSWFRRLKIFCDHW
ncbi:hypothetical protein QBD00_001093 [Ochrobactrum sp. AN78]|nr:hypothetical protein [Ochrobactrum sp. AN78]